MVNNRYRTLNSDFHKIKYSVVLLEDSSKHLVLYSDDLNNENNLRFGILRKNSIIEMESPEPGENDAPDFFYDSLSNIIIFSGKDTAYFISISSKNPGITITSANKSVTLHGIPSTVQDSLFETLTSSYSNAITLSVAFDIEDIPGPPYNEYESIYQFRYALWTIFTSNVISSK